jgi:hypothetical protein
VTAPAIEVKALCRILRGICVARRRPQEAPAARQIPQNTKRLETKSARRRPKKSIKKNPAQKNRVLIVGLEIEIGLHSQIKMYITE